MRLPPYQDLQTEYLHRAKDEQTQRFGQWVWNVYHNVFERNSWPELFYSIDDNAILLLLTPYLPR